MSPAFSTQHCLDERMAHAHTFSNNPADNRWIQRVNLSHLLAVKFQVAPTVSSTIHLVLHVFQRRAVCDVGWIAARWIVTGVKRQLNWHMPMREKEGSAVRANHRHSHSHAPISVLVSLTHPRPTGIGATGLIHPAPEPRIGIFDSVWPHMDIVAQGVS